MKHAPFAGATIAACVATLIALKASGRSL